MSKRNLFRFVLLSTAIALCACSSLLPVEPAIKASLAPSGTLKVGVYKGSPTSLVQAEDGQNAGMAHDLGVALAKRLDVPVQVVTFDRLALVLDALKAGQVDMSFTNASPARQREYSFTQPLLSLELGYLVPRAGKMKNIAEVDQTGIRIGVSQGSSSQTALSSQLKLAKLNAYASLDAAKSALLKNEIDGFATNKGILNELLDDLSKSGNFKILDGRWGLEHMGIAIPKARAAANPAAAAFVQSFGSELKADGTLSQMAKRAGLRGTVTE